MLQGDAASPIRPPCSDSSRLTEETRGVRNHPDPVNGASGPAPSNAPNPPQLPPHPALPPVRAGSRLSGHTRTHGGNVCPLSAQVCGARRGRRQGVLPDVS